jgi:hypothetical protein
VDVFEQARRAASDPGSDSDGAAWSDTASGEQLAIADDRARPLARKSKRQGSAGTGSGKRSTRKVVGRVGTEGGKKKRKSALRGGTRVSRAQGRRRDKG